MRALTWIPSVTRLRAIVRIGVCVGIWIQPPAWAIEWVPIGDAPNLPDPRTGRGAVSAPFEISRCEITCSEYAEFLNAVAEAGDPHGLWDPRMDSPKTAANQDDGKPRFIRRSGTPGAYRYAVYAGEERKPVRFVNYLSALRMANWLHHGAITGAPTEFGAYEMRSGKSPDSRENGARVWLPDENEWYKAAYFHPASAGGPAGGYWMFPCRSDQAPDFALPGSVAAARTNVAAVAVEERTNAKDWFIVGDVGSFQAAASHYGTVDQAGNVWEWVETPVFGNQRILRGGSSSHPPIKTRSDIRTSMQPKLSFAYVGFRLARSMKCTSEK